jgi:hypothetical protein
MGMNDRFFLLLRTAIFFVLFLESKCTILQVVSKLVFRNVNFLFPFEGGTSISSQFVEDFSRTKV